MLTRKMQVPVFALLLGMGGLIAACGDDDTNDTQPEGTDPGGDGDADSDSDTRPGGDTDTLPPLNNYDTDQYGNPEAGCDPQPEDPMLTAKITDDAAWVAQCENRFGLQGAWFSYTDVSDGGGSSITMDYSQAASGKICASGVGGKVYYQEFAKYWGAGFGMNLCTTGTDDERVVGTLGDCTLFDPRTKIIGFRITVEGDNIPAGPGGGDPQFRIQFAETGRAESTYLIVDGEGGTADYYFEDALVHYAVARGDTDVPPINIDNIESLQFQISTVPEADTEFSVCVSNIIPILE